MFVVVVALIYAGLYIFFNKVRPQEYDLSKTETAKPKIYPTSIPNKRPLFLDNSSLLLWDESQIILYDIDRRKSLHEFRTAKNKSIRDLHPSNDKIFALIDNKVVTFDRSLNKLDGIETSEFTSLAVGNSLLCVSHDKELSVFEIDGDHINPEYVYSIDSEHQLFYCNTKYVFFTPSHPNLEQRLFVKDIKTGKQIYEYINFQELIPSPGYLKIGIRRENEIVILDTQDLTSWSIAIEKGKNTGVVKDSGEYIFPEFNKNNKLILTSETPRESKTIAEIDSPLTFRNLLNSSNGKSFAMIDKDGEVWILKF